MAGNQAGLNNGGTLLQIIMLGILRSILQMTTEEISLMENNLWLKDKKEIIKKANKDIETKVYGFVLYVVHRQKVRYIICMESRKNQIILDSWLKAK